MCDQELPGGGEAQRTPVLLDDRYAGFALEDGQLLRDGRRGQVQYVGGCGDRAVGGQVLQDPQAPHIKHEDILTKLDHAGHDDFRFLAGSAIGSGGARREIPSVLRHFGAAAVDQYDTGNGDGAAGQFDQVRDLAQPHEGDDQRHGRHQVQRRGRGGQRQACDGVAPEHEAESGRQEPEEDGREQGVGGGVGGRTDGRRQQRQGEDGAGDHGVGGDFEAGAAVQQRFGGEVVGALDDGRGQDDKGCGGEAGEAVGQGDGSGSGDGDDTADDDVARQRLGQECAGQQDAEDRCHGYQQTGGAGLDVDLAPVEQHLVGGHPGESAQGDQRQVAAVGQAYPGEGGDSDQGDGGDGQAQERQGCRAQAVDTDADRRERGGPEHDGSGQGQEAGGG